MSFKFKTPELVSPTQDKEHEIIAFLNSYTPERFKSAPIDASTPKEHLAKRLERLSHVYKYNRDLVAKAILGLDLPQREEKEIFGLETSTPKVAQTLKIWHGYPEWAKTKGESHLILNDEVWHPHYNPCPHLCNITQSFKGRYDVHIFEGVNVDWKFDSQIVKAGKHNQHPYRDSNKDVWYHYTKK